MEIKLIVVGRTVEKYLLEGETIYTEKLKHYIKFSEGIITVKKTKNKDKTALKINESNAILTQIKPADILVLLDAKGKNYTSVAFSDFLKKQMNGGVKRLVFVIGGAYGFSPQIYKRANYLVALSKMTFSHQMVRLIFKEQLYRGFSILKNEPYHHQ